MPAAAELLCDNCGAPARYSRDEGDGNYCSYWCDLCIELVDPDGVDPSLEKID